MEELLKLYTLETGVFKQDNLYFISGQLMSKVEMENNLKVLNNLVGISKLVISLRTEIDYLKNKNQEIQQELTHINESLLCQS